MKINPAVFLSGKITLSESIPSISLGRSVIATVLAAPKDGTVLVSMFGKRLLVETTMPLEKGQVLNLKVHAVSPRIILKPMEAEAAVRTTSLLKDLGSAISELVGKHSEKPMKSFLIQEIIRQLTSPNAQDAPAAQFVTSLVDQVLQYPQALAYLFVPLVDDQSRAAAQVSIEREGDAYILNFDIETDNIGNIECRARLDHERGIDVEIRTLSEEIASFLKAHVQELKNSLDMMNVRSVEVLHTRLRRTLQKEVNVLV